MHILQKEQGTHPSETVLQFLAHSLSWMPSNTVREGISGGFSHFKAAKCSDRTVSAFQSAFSCNQKGRAGKFGTRPPRFQKLKVYQLIEAPLLPEQVSEQSSHRQSAPLQNQQSEQNAVKSFSNNQNPKTHQPPLKNPIKNAVKKVNRLLINFLKKEIKSGRFPQAQTEEIQKFVNKELEEKNFLNHTFIKSLILLRKLDFSMDIVRVELLKMLERSQQKQQKKNARIYRSFMQYKERAILTVVSFQKQQLIDCIKFMYNRHPINRITHVLHQLETFEGYTQKYLGSLCSGKGTILHQR